MLWIACADDVVDRRSVFGAGTRLGSCRGVVFWESVRHHQAEVVHEPSGTEALPGISAAAPTPLFA